VVLVVGWEAYNWRAPRENCKALGTMGRVLKANDNIWVIKNILWLSYSVCGWMLFRASIHMELGAMCSYLFFNMSRILKCYIVQTRPWMSITELNWYEVI
jgi:hypothetical protein